MSASAGGRAAWRRVRAMVLKEWLELRRNRMVLSVIVFVPLLMVAIPVAMLAVMSRVGVSQGDVDEMAALIEKLRAGAATAADKKGVRKLAARR